jgi:hypothetical protein
MSGKPMVFKPSVQRFNHPDTIDMSKSREFGRIPPFFSCHSREMFEKSGPEMQTRCRRSDTIRLRPVVRNLESTKSKKACLLTHGPAICNAAVLEHIRRQRAQRSHSLVPAIHTQQASPPYPKSEIATYPIAPNRRASTLSFCPDNASEFLQQLSHVYRTFLRRFSFCETSLFTALLFLASKRLFVAG